VQKEDTSDGTYLDMDLVDNVWVDNIPDLLRLADSDVEPWDRSRLWQTERHLI
jgi:hypothetical protein